MGSRLTDLVDKAIEKYGSILGAPENCEEFLEIRRISPDDEKPGTVEFEERKKRKTEKDKKILDLIEQGYTAKMVAKEVHWSVGAVREHARRYGAKFGKYYKWYAERNGIKYYSSRKEDLVSLKFKEADIKDVKQARLLKFDLPDGVHYCENGKWHIRR